MTQRTPRERMVAAAFELFEERGYDDTTVDAIVERAATGRTTFFRAFGSKEDVIFPDHEQILDRIRVRLAASTQGTGPVAITEAARLVLEHYLAEGELAMSRYRLTRSVPALRGRELAGILQYQQLFRAFIHTWMGETPETALRAELFAAAVVTAHNQVLRRWLRGLTTNPRADFDLAMDEVHTLFADRTDDGDGSTVVVLRSTQSVGTVLPALRQALRETN